MVNSTDEAMAITNEMVVGAKVRNAYSTHFAKNFNIDGSPTTVELESIFNAPQDNIESIVGYAKYCYRKYGIIMRVINIIRDFGATGIKLEYPNSSAKARKVIEDYNKRINMNQLVRDFIYELALTGNLACYDRDGKRVDIYPINLIDVVPLVIDNKQVIGYKMDNLSSTFSTYDRDIASKIESAYPKEIIDAMKNGNSLAILNGDNAYFAKINASQYEPYGLSVILPAFEDLAHKSLLKEAEKATANDIIDKIMLIQIGDKDNKPTRDLIEQYTALLNDVRGSVRLTVPYYVNASYVEPETSVFTEDKFIEVDTDILNTLGISLSLIRGESGGNYSEGIINFSGLVRTIEGIREPLLDIIESLYKKELKRNGLKETFAPKVTFNEVVIDKEQKLNLVKELFASAGLPYQVLYEEFGYDFDSIKLIREEENKEDMEETFKLHSLPFSGIQESGDEEKEDNQDKAQKQIENDKGGAPTKTDSQRKSGKSNVKNQKTGLTNTNRTSK